MATFTKNEITGALVVAYGLHVVSGHVVQKVTEGSGDSAQTTLIVWLGEGIWNRILHAYWAGAELDETTYHFHNGYYSDSMAAATYGLNINSGLNEWTQGVDPWNVGGQTCSGTAYVIIKLPVGVSENNNFEDLKFICECLRVANYDNTGRQLDKDGVVVGTVDDLPNRDYFFYSTNPALVVADLLLVRRKLNKNRINWAAWTTWRDFNDTVITWTGGNVADRPTFENVVNFVQGADAQLFKAYGTNTSWDAAAFTASAISSGMDGFFEIDIATGHLLAGLSNNNSLGSGGGVDFALSLHFHSNGNVELYEGGTFKGVISTWVTGDRFRIAEESNVWKIYKYGELIDISGLGLSSPSYPLYGGVEGFNIESEILRANMNPSGSVSSERTRKRFECGLAFPTQTDIASAVEAVLYICCGEMQDGETLTFLPPTITSSPKTSVFSFDATNMIPDSFKVYRTARDQKPTKIPGTFRNSDSPTLKEESVSADRDSLVDLLGRENPASEVYLGTITRGQAECVLNYQLRRDSDLDLYCTFQASGTSWKVLPGDITSVTQEAHNFVNVLFEVIESTDESSIDTPDLRTFVCQIFNPSTYSDTDQTALTSNVTITKFDILPPSDFEGVFDSQSGDVLFGWNSGTQLDNPLFESYTLQILDEDNSVLRTQNIYPYLNNHLQEYLIWDTAPAYPPIVSPAPTANITLIEDGGIMISSSNSTASLASAEVVGGFLVEFQIPDYSLWLPMNYMSVWPTNSYPISGDFAFIWKIEDRSGPPWYSSTKWWAVPGEFEGIPFARPAMIGDRLGIYIRPDGIAEYHINYGPSSKPIFISGRPVDESVSYKAGVTGVGRIEKVSWLRQGPEWKYLASAQRGDRELDVSDPLPNRIIARVRQNSPFAIGNPSEWKYGVFNR